MKPWEGDSSSGCWGTKLQSPRDRDEECGAGPSQSTVQYEVRTGMRTWRVAHTLGPDSKAMVPTGVGGPGPAPGVLSAVY